MNAGVGTHLENRILDSLRSRPGVRFAPSGLRTVLDERQVVARMEPLGARNARPTGVIRGRSQRCSMSPNTARNGNIKRLVFLRLKRPQRCVLMLARDRGAAGAIYDGGFFKAAPDE